MNFFFPKPPSDIICKRYLETIDRLKSRTRKNILSKEEIRKIALDAVFLAKEAKLNRKDVSQDIKEARKEAFLQNAKIIKEKLAGNKPYKPYVIESLTNALLEEYKHAGVSDKEKEKEAAMQKADAHRRSAQAMLDILENEEIPQSMLHIKEMENDIYEHCKKGFVRFPLSPIETQRIETAIERKLYGNALRLKSWYEKRIGRLGLDQYKEVCRTITLLIENMPSVRKLGKDSESYKNLFKRLEKELLPRRVTCVNGNTFSVNGNPPFSEPSL